MCGSGGVGVSGSKSEWEGVGVSGSKSEWEGVGEWECKRECARGESEAIVIVMTNT